MIKSRNELNNLDESQTMRVCFGLWALLMVSSCTYINEPDKNSERDWVLESMYAIMHDSYLWYDAVPILDPTSYLNPNQLLDDLRYQNPGPDKWSFIIDSTTYMDYFVRGVSFAHGISFAFEYDQYPVVTKVNESSTVYSKGVRRGDTLTLINGEDAKELTNNKNIQYAFGKDESGVSNVLSFSTLKNEQISESFAKEELDIKTVKKYSVFESEQGPIGYLLFMTFIDKSFEELEEAFTFFETRGVTNLIVDFRYNGGGRLDVAEYLANLMAGNSHAGKTFVTLQANNKHTAENTTFLLKKVPHGLDIAQVVFISSPSTASASEYVMKGVGNYLESYTVGETSGGKPVGMDQFDLIAYKFFPISFIGADNENTWDFFDGLPANKILSDDLLHPLGSPEEARLKAAIDYFEGDVSAVAAKSAIQNKRHLELVGFKGLQGFF